MENESQPQSADLQGNTKEKDRTMPLTILELELHQARVQRNRH